MKVLVLSDSHGNLKNVFTAIDFLKDEISYIIHTGDFITDTNKIKKNYKDIGIFAVPGNNDFFEDDFGNSSSLLNISNKKIFLTHGHLYNVYFGVNKLFYRAKELGADICLFGHTHIPFLEENDGVFFLNPGSISFPRASSTPTFALLDITEDKVSAKIYGVFEDNIKEIHI